MHTDVTALPGTDLRRTHLALLAAAALAFLFAIGAPEARADVGVSVSTPPGESGNATITVTRTGLLNLSSTTVTITTAAGTAVPGEDYVATPTPQTVTFGALEGGSKSASVALINDARDEPGQTFTASISASGGEAVTNQSATGTINDDDPAPVLAIADRSAAEGTGAAPAPLLFTVTVGAVSEQEIKVRWEAEPQVTGGDASTLASPGSDFSPVNGELVIGPGAASGTIAVPVTADNVDERDETFAVTLSQPVNGDLAGTGARSGAVGTIVNDDIPTILVASDAVREGDSGAATLTLPVTLSNPSTRAISASFSTGDFPEGTAGAATAGTDYQPASGTVAWDPGDTSARSIAIAINGDTLPETDELFLITLNAVNAAVLGPPSALGGILNDDGGNVVPGQAGAGTGTGFDGTGTGAGDRSRPNVAMSKLTSPRAGRLRFTLTCPATETSCRGKVTIFTVVQGRSRYKVLRAERTVGIVNVSLRQGQQKAYSVRLSVRLRKALRPIKRVKVIGYAVIRDAAGNATTAQARGTLRVR